MDDPAERLADLGRIARAYGELRLAVAFTDGIEGEGAKRITGSWNRTKPLAGPEFAVGLMDRCTHRNPAIVLGASGLIGIDIDAGGGERLSELAIKLPRTVTVRTGKGYHAYFRPPEGAPGPAVYELSASGVAAWTEKYFVAPPALHPSGGVYAFLKDRAPWDREIAQLPLEALETMHAAASSARDNGGARVAGEPIREGERNDVLFRDGCAMRRRGMGEEAIRAALAVENAERCQPPLTEDELRRIAASAATYERGATADKRLSPAPGTARVVELASVRLEEVDWVRPGWLARGKLSVLDGLPDVGKSTIAADFAARATAGMPFPGGGPGFGSPVGVLVAAAVEDGTADTIKPRVLAAGGDASRVYVLEGFEVPERGLRPFELPRDIAALVNIVERHRVGLIWLDSLMASLPGGVDSHRDQDVRRALHPLATLAMESGAAVLFLRHPTKGGQGPALYRGGGSVGIVGVVRCALMALADPEDETGKSRLLAVTKCNLVPRSAKATIAYAINPARVEEAGISVEVGHVRWGAADPRGADAILAAAAAGDRQERADAGAVMILALEEAGVNGLGAEAMEAVRKAHDIGRHAWERERAQLRRDGRIWVEQPGKDEGAGGRSEAVWRLAGLGPPPPPGGPSPGGPSQPHGQGDLDPLGDLVPQAPVSGGPSPPEASAETYAHRFRASNEPLFPDPEEDR